MPDIASLAIETRDVEYDSTVFPFASGCCTNQQGAEAAAGLSCLPEAFTQNS